MTQPEIEHLIAEANAARARGTVHDAEAQLEALFHHSTRLAVYGTLVPGRANHHVIAPLGGEWQQGYVEGDLHPTGWGASLGYPALRLRPGGPRVAVHVLTTSRLPDAWPMLDGFEGPGYLRALAPILDDGRLVTVANVYEGRA